MTAVASANVSVLCPSCGVGTCASDRAFVCDRCGHAVPVRHGFPSLTTPDEFYEHQCTNTLRMPLVDRLPLPLKPLAYLDFICNERHRRNRFFRRVVNRLPKRASLLDIGCGGGMEIWLRLGQVTGLSNSFTGLKQASTIYASCVHADLGAGLPFPDESYDYIVASDIIGHFDEAGRNRLLSEIRRCLKRDGRFIAVIEGLGSWFDDYTRGNPQLRDAYIDAGIKRAGHIGLETPSRIFRRLRDNGFVVEHHEPFGAHPGSVDGYFTPHFQEFPSPSFTDRVAKSISRVVRHNRVATRVMDNVFGVINSINLSRSDRWHDGVMVLCRRDDA